MTTTKRIARELAKILRRADVPPSIDECNAAATALERAAELEEWLTVAKQSYTCPFCNEIYGPRKISTEDLREAVRLHAPTCDKHPLTQRIAELEAQLAAAQEALLEREADWNAVVRIARQQAEALGYLWNCDLSAADRDHVRPAMEAYNQADVIGGPMCAARRAEGAEHE